VRVHIRGAQEHNLSNVDVEIGDGLTVVTGVSGSGKTSLVFDTLYHEARRRFLDIFGGTTRLAPANVRSITGLGPAVAVGQNLLNRNPASTLATASGLHPFFRLLYARFGKRHCARCGAGLEHWTEDEIVERVASLVLTEGSLTVQEPGAVIVRAILLRGVPGSHRTLLDVLQLQFGAAALYVDGQVWEGAALESTQPHDLDVQVAELDLTQDSDAVLAEGQTWIGRIRAALHTAWGLGANAVQVLPVSGGVAQTASALVLSRAPVCATCGTWFADLEPVHFKTECPTCGGAGCARCNGTGLHPQAAAVRWQGLDLPGLLSRSVEKVRDMFDGAGLRHRAEAVTAQDTAAAGVVALPYSAGRLRVEIKRRLDALYQVGLGYVSLDRPSPTLSRGESQRVRLAVALTSRLEDMLHVLDEPTIGQHPADVANLLPAFRDLAGPVVYVEHDRVAAAGADRVVDLGPGAGEAGGRIVFEGTPSELWQADTPTGRYFSLRERVSVPGRPALVPEKEPWLTVRQAGLRNLDDIDVSIPIGHFTVITGVSGSGKSTFVEDVLAASLQEGQPVGCRAVLVTDRWMDVGAQTSLKCTIVDQSPIGRNPRSNPATYTKLSDIVRDLYASVTGLSASHFSFNRPEGACPTCKGIGAIETRMRYLPSTWVPCEDCGGQRFSEEVLAAKVSFRGARDTPGPELSIADFYELSIADVALLLSAVPVQGKGTANLPASSRRRAERILGALQDIGLGYLRLGQPSPTLSGGEAQRVKLAKYLGQRSLESNLLILDEPSTGLHPADVAGLLSVVNRLVREGATVVVVEHNTDVIRTADWVIDLGPGAGPAGGRVLYAGPPSGLLAEPVEALDSATGRALREESLLEPGVWLGEQNAAGAGRGVFDGEEAQPVIRIRGASAHNLRNVDVDLPKGALTVVTGVSGSGKSSLVVDVLEAEARRRFLESLSLYERQGTHEGPEAPVRSVSGLGVTVTVTPERRLYARRSTVGTVTELGHHLAVLLARVGNRRCTACVGGNPAIGQPEGILMQRTGLGTRERWICPDCGASAPVAQPRHFNPTNYAAACTICNGVGSLRQPNPGKLIVHPEKPLCGGAMYSPGFFPQGYLCKPYNGGYYEVRAYAARYEFDPDRTPWNEMSHEAQHAFLFGDPEPMTFRYESRTGRTHSRTGKFGGFYRWIGDWDVGGTYTDTLICPGCGGGKLRPEYAGVFLRGSTAVQGAATGGRDLCVNQEYTLHSLSTMSLAELYNVLQDVERRLSYEPDSERRLREDEHAREIVFSSLRMALDRLAFLLQVGLGYIHLDRLASTLSAGEAQRIRLAGLLGSGLVSLTVLLDEPSRGLHPSEVGALVEALKSLRDEGNTVIVVEHDPEVILAADHLIDVGPGPGAAGGLIVAQGTPEVVARQDTTTARWLRGERKLVRRERRLPRGWMTIHGARANNLCDVTVRFPLETFVGLCGVSGSGKSTLLIDTLGRVLAPKKQTTSVAYEDVDPGEHDAIEGAPDRVILVDQTRKGVHSPANFFGLNKPIHELYAQGQDARALGLDANDLGQHCSACGGRGTTRIDMGFLPAVHTKCEVCRGTGYRPEAWQICYLGVPLPELFSMTIDQAYDLFQECGPSESDGSSQGTARSQSKLVGALAAAREVGLGYLVLRQPGYSLSGGEAQRLKIAQELCRPTGAGAKPARSRGTLYILDEPTLGQHLEDVARLCSVLDRLVDDGHTVLVSEHHPYLLAACDWLVELGPGGGPQGGRVLAEGTPERLAGGDTPTAPYLAALLEGAQDA